MRSRDQMLLAQDGLAQDAFQMETGMMQHSGNTGECNH